MCRPGSPTWQTTDTLLKNYAANDLLLDPNEGFGRNRAAAAPPLKTPAERAAADGVTHEDDDGAARAPRRAPRPAELHGLAAGCAARLLT